MSDKTKALWALGISSAAVFMVTLDNLVVSTALPTIRRDLHASLQSLEWTVNAYTLTFAVLLLTGAALGDRFGRKRMLAAGLSLFTLASAAAALAPDATSLVVARAAQGVGGAIVMPLTLTIISGAFPKEKRAAAIGVWGAVAGLAVALGPVVGGAIVDGISWQWIFWINVPFGIVLVPLALRNLSESHGPSAKLDLKGLALASAGLFGIVWGVVRSQELGWTSGEVVFALTAGAVGVALFLVWEATAEAPMLPLGLFKNRTFAAANAATFLMYVGFFGAVFLITQYWQFAHGYSPLGAGLRILPWTVMPMFIAAPAGQLATKYGERPLLIIGLSLISIAVVWLGYVATPDASYLSILPALTIGGIGSSLFWAPSASIVFSSVGPEQEGVASGANNSIRELGGVFGVAILTTIFSSHGSFVSPEQFVDGLRPALYVGGALVAVASVAAFTLPRRRAAAGSYEPALAA
ncbi:MAG TPA: DHA2 family efflux MFS transporter permease subunit [Gaiellaceae bacterium]|nr:DHA2 family efflux MFS transporter permease subunit [Gaiellaceae bacterium]